jgi:hypothetical protein
MQAHKINNFVAERPEENFPYFQTLAGPEADSLRQKWASILQLQSDTDGLSVLNEIRRNSRSIDADAEAADFDLAGTLRGEGVVTRADVFLNWDRFATVDRMKFVDLALFFGDIWYPSSDDLEVFDDSFTWILSIHHFGHLSLWMGSMHG